MSGAMSTGTVMRSRYVLLDLSKQQVVCSGLGDAGLFTGGTGQTSETRIVESCGGSLGILKPTNQMEKQSGLAGVSGLGISV